MEQQYVAMKQIKSEKIIICAFSFFLSFFFPPSIMQRATATEDLTSVEWRDTNWLEVCLIL